MKRFIFGIAFFLTVALSVFAQNDLQPLAVVKLNKSETITLKLLRSRVEIYQKQSGATSFSIDDKKQILESLIQEKLIVQAAQKEGLAAQITDTVVNQHFVQSLSQQAGRNVTESEFADIVKKQTGKTMDQLMMEQVGMSLADYKAYLKNQLIAQSYILQKKGEEIGKIAASDTEIRSFYDMNKAAFVQNDMVKIFLVVVPKIGNVDDARVKANKMLNDLKDKKSNFDSIKSGVSKNAGYQAGDLFISKTAQHAQQLGISYNELTELFGKNVGYTSELNETPNDFQFYSVRAKYPAKMLGIGDSVQPEANLTVYDYIKGNLTQQKQSQALLAAADEITKSLDTAANVDRKKTGDALDKLLAW